MPPVGCGSGGAAEPRPGVNGGGGGPPPDGIGGGGGTGGPPGEDIRGGGGALDEDKGEGRDGPEEAGAAETSLGALGSGDGAGAIGALR